jgi:hypothetical protein
VTWSLIIPHGAELEFACTGALTIRHPKLPTVRVRSREPGRFVLGPITTEGQRLELRR